MYRNHYIHQTPFPHNRDYSYDQLVDAAAFALRTIGKLSSAASENSDLKREIGDLTNTNRSLTATVRRQETEIADLKAQLNRQETGVANVVVHELKAEYEKLDTLSAAIVASSDLVIFVPAQQHECAVCLEEVCNLRVKFRCDCVNRVCPVCFHQSLQVCPICRAVPE
jgi:septal ring factor EnvC (AmiA/AmiB activator)